MNQKDRNLVKACALLVLLVLALGFAFNKALHLAGSEISAAQPGEYFSRGPIILTAFDYFALKKRIVAHPTRNMRSASSVFARQHSRTGIRYVAHAEAQRKTTRLTQPKEQKQKNSPAPARARDT